MSKEPQNEGLAWYVVRTLTKREALAAKILAQNEEIEVLCPRVRYKKATKRGTVWWKEAMFPGYFFAHFSVATHGRLVSHSQGVTGLVKFNSNIPAVPESIIQELKRELESVSVETEHEHTITLQPQINEGDEVEIAHGAMAGQKGIVTRVLEGHERVAVLLEFLGANHEVELDLFSLFLQRPITPE